MRNGIHRAVGSAVPESEKLERWAELQGDANPSTIHAVQMQQDSSIAFEGWRLGHSTEEDVNVEGSQPWKRREATIFLTKDGRLLCYRRWLPFDGAFEIIELNEYETDLDLLTTFDMRGNQPADKCVLDAGAQAAKVCPLFGLRGVQWLDNRAGASTFSFSV